MRYLLFILFVLFNVKNSNAQSEGSVIVNAAGGTYVQDSIIYEWSVGELALIETMESKVGSITNGLLQPIVPSQLIITALNVFPSNILTANADGKNDTWIIKGLEKYPDNEVGVFDRAGRIVFSAKDYQNDWTGKLSGAPLKEGTYYYIIKIKKGGKSGLIKGFITILN